MKAKFIPQPLICGHYFTMTVSEFHNSVTCLLVHYDMPENNTVAGVRERGRGQALDQVSSLRDIPCFVRSLFSKGNKND